MFILKKFNFPPPHLNYALCSMLEIKFLDGNIIRWHGHAQFWHGRALIEALVVQPGGTAVLESGTAVPESKLFGLCTFLSGTTMLNFGMAVPEYILWYTE